MHKASNVNAPPMQKPVTPTLPLPRFFTYLTV
jgi:hypothetical protein